MSACFARIASGSRGCENAIQTQLAIRMTQETTDRKGAKSDAAEKKKRLADALRRNLAKRKDAKNAKNVDNP